MTEARLLDVITDSMDMDLSKLQETVENRGAWHATVYEAAKRWTWLSDWTTTIYMYMCICMHACSLICDSLRLMNCSWSGSSVHEILQARLLEWVAKSSSRQSTWSRDWTHVSYVAILAGGSLPPSQPGKPIYVCIYMCVYIYIYIYMCVCVYIWSQWLLYVAWFQQLKYTGPAKIFKCRILHGPFNH